MLGDVIAIGSIVAAVLVIISVVCCWVGEKKYREELRKAARASDDGKTRGCSDCWCIECGSMWMNAKNYESACMHCDFCVDGDWKIKHKPKCYVE